MKKNIAIAVISITLLLAGAIPLAFSDSSGTAEVLDATPALAGLYLRNAAETVDKAGTAISIDTEYHIKFTIEDDNSLANLNNVTIIVWNNDTTTENGANAETNHYTITWVESTDTWTSTPSGFVITDNCVDPGTGATGTSYVFTCAFDLSKVASHTTSNTAWQIKITVWDDQGASASDSTLQFGVAFYSEISITDTTHSWTGLVPGDIDKTVDGDGDIDFAVIANSNWDAQAKSNASNLVSGSNTIGIENLSIHKDTLGSAVALTTSWADMGGLTTQSPPTAEASPSNTYCTLWLDIPDGTLPGDYVYTLQLQIVEA